MLKTTSCWHTEWFCFKQEKAAWLKKKTELKKHQHKNNVVKVSKNIVRLYITKSCACTFSPVSVSTAVKTRREKRTHSDLSAVHEYKDSWSSTVRVETRPNGQKKLQFYCKMLASASRGSKREVKGHGRHVRSEKNPKSVKQKWTTGSGSDVKYRKYNQVALQGWNYRLQNGCFFRKGKKYKLINR